MTTVISLTRIDDAGKRTSLGYYLLQEKPFGMIWTEREWVSLVPGATMPARIHPVADYLMETSNTRVITIEYDGDYKLILCKEEVDEGS